MKILVDGLPWSFTDRDLTNLLTEHGGVSAAIIIRDPVTDQSRGFGFVEMAPECAERAIASLHGYQLNDRTLTVNAAKEQIPA